MPHQHNPKWAARVGLAIPITTPRSVESLPFMHHRKRNQAQERDDSAVVDAGETALPFSIELTVVVFPIDNSGLKLMPDQKVPDGTYRNLA